ncbi:MFS transporter [Microbispora sp. NPDC049125]|uniref:MFS transporter n=1 Tax=Microbispora sp. NPDC049125 TaxID=3154929 RepID=UPI0034651590
MTDVTPHPVETISPTEQPTPSWGTLLVVLAGTFVTVLDFFILNVAIPSIQLELHATPAQIQLMIAGYGVAFASLMITSGRLGDQFGRRRIFTIGLAVFTLASLASGLAPNAEELIIARVVQGVGAALLTPQVLGIINTVYTGKSRVAAFNAYGLTNGFAGVFGQLIGGALIVANPDDLGWRTIFLINVPIGVLGLAFAGRTVPESRGDGKRLDLLGTLLVTAGLVAIVLPLVEGREQGWPEWAVISLVVSVPLLAAFAAYQRRLTNKGGTPLIDLSLFRERAFTVGVLATLAFFLAMGSCFLVLSLYLQEGRGMSPLGSGLVYVALGVGFFLSSAMAPQLVPKLGKQVLAVGGLLVAAGYGVLGFTASDIGVAGSVWWLVPSLLVAGFGMGMVMAPLSSTVLERVQPHHAAAASGVLSTAQELAGALGVALVGIVFFGALGGTPQAADFPRAFDLSMIMLVVFALVVALLVQLLPRAARQPA